MISAEWLYWLIGAFFVVVAVLIATNPNHPRRLPTAAFWGVWGVGFFYSTFVVSGTAPAWLLGVLTLVLVVIAGFNIMAKGKEEVASAEVRAERAGRLKNKLFIPALTVPLVTVVVAVLGPMVDAGGKPLLAEGSATLTGLGVGAIAALIVAYVILRPPSAAAPFREGTRLLEAIGWAALLPQMLSTLGQLFAKAGVGDAIGDIVHAIVPENSLLWAVVAYTVGNALFTVLMGNAFAAFPIMTAAVGWPVLVETFDGNPAAIFAMGMLAGFCGTLMTPMAANFNIVPAALLEMKNKNGVIAVQIPTALMLLVVTTAFMFAFSFPHLA